MMAFRIAARASSRNLSLTGGKRRFSDVAIPPPVRREVSLEERAALRAARKDRASRQLANHDGSSGGSSGGSSAPIAQLSAGRARWIWYASVVIPGGLFAWGYNDENSPPAKLSEMIGLSDFVRSFTDELAKPANDKLLPAWNDMPNVPHDITIPHTLVLDLEETLVSSTWDRKYGWRHAKRPGVDKFLRTMSQYYEIVLYSPSIDAVADPVVNSLDPGACIMHRLYRDATHYKNGVHVKALDRLNRDTNRMILLDDDEAAGQFNPDNLIRVKPYEDPTDRTDRTLERITPFLVEIARQGHSDIPSVLRQYRGMDADQIADEYQRRIDNLRYNRRNNPSVLGGLAARGNDLPPPEMTPSTDDGAPQQMTAKDIVGAPPPSTGSGSGGMVSWMNKRAQEKEEQNMRKMEKWNEIMLKKQQAKKEAAAGRN